jgi:hypothetical protein
MMDKRPDLLYGSQDTILAYLVAEVIPRLRTVSRDTTANYYHSLHEGGGVNQLAGKRSGA